MERLAAEGTVNALRTALTEASRAGSEQAERAASLYSRAEEQAGERAEERRVRAGELVMRGAASAAGQAPCALQHLQQVDGEQGG